MITIACATLDTAQPPERPAQRAVRRAPAAESLRFVRLPTIVNASTDLNIMRTSVDKVALKHVEKSQIAAITPCAPTSFASASKTSPLIQAATVAPPAMPRPIARKTPVARPESAPVRVDTTR